jgi:hypothetical protein
MRHPRTTPFKGSVEEGGQYAPPSPSTISPFLSNYESRRVYLQCNACQVVYTPKIWSEDGCPCCGSQDGATPLISVFKPARNTHLTRRTIRATACIPPTAWQAFIAPSDTFKRGVVQDIKEEVFREG